MEGNGQNEHFSWLYEKVALLEQQIRDKETIIGEKERIIKILSQRK